MVVVALAAARWVLATWRSAGVPPNVFPPLDSASFPLWMLAAADLWYVNLHGERGAAAWYGDDRREALTARQVATVRAAGAVAFVTSCYGLGEDGRPGPMVEALLGAGCAAVVAGVGLNYGGLRAPVGVDVLGGWFRRLLDWGLPAGRALQLAKLRVRLTPRLTLADRDALEFRLLGDAGARLPRRKGGWSG